MGEPGSKPCILAIRKNSRRFWSKRRTGGLSVTFYPGINEYMGRRSLQIVITHCQ